MMNAGVGEALSSPSAALCRGFSPLKVAEKNPHAIRAAEERRGLDQLTMNVAVNLSRAWQLSSHIHNMCSEARDAIYTRERDSVDVVPVLLSCRSTRDLWQACSCSYSLRLEWYPCLLKYCRNRDTTGKGSPYKCGIKSCSKGYHFTYYVPHKQLCLWDEET
ncbi:unnamed protein product [Coregonus sp. 'balchen']|nr:unnamed protein product [Coregonus sp. 'balchen']